jgi:hypothetical protein
MVTGKLVFMDEGAQHGLLPTTDGIAGGRVRGPNLGLIEPFTVMPRTTK